MCEVATESFYIGTFGSQIHVITKTLKSKPKLWGDLLALVILVFQFNVSTGLAHNDVYNTWWYQMCFQMIYNLWSQNCLNV